jgi:hypothetical protein
MLSSEHSPLPQRVRVPAVAADVEAVADAVVAAQQVEQQHRPEHPQQTRGVDVVLAVAVTLFPRFVDPRHNRGFHSSRGLQPSTITTRQTR